jgi:arylsulfatase A-like enzyme
MPFQPPVTGIAIILVAVILSAALGEQARAASQQQSPNIVIIFADDLGYGDIGCFGAKGYQTPNLDRMAQEGRKFTSFYVAQAVCGASRAALLTGCYSNRIGMLGAPGPSSKHGINADEVLLSELCRQKGYATAIYGKWHLGHHHPFLPLQNGFDDYFGLPYSNDMWPYHPTAKFPDLPMFHGNEIVIPAVSPKDQHHLTQWYTEHATKFIDDHQQQPFFLYLAHSMPHVPLFVSENFANKTERGLFGDVISEIDWSVGRILDSLKQHHLDDRTLVIFTSDNGPWLSYGNHAGSAGPLREGKGTSWEGGLREPCVMRWPGKIPAGTTCEELAATIDVLPTVARLIDAKLPDHAIDGKDISALMFGGPDAKTPHEYYCYYWGNHLDAIRSGDWKLHLPHSYRTLKGEPGRDGKPGLYQQAHTDLALYNLKEDIGESVDVKAQHPDVVARLKAYAELARKELGDSATKQTGSGYRAPGTWNQD